MSIDVRLLAVMSPFSAATTAAHNKILLMHPFVTLERVRMEPNGPGSIRPRSNSYKWNSEGLAASVHSSCLWVVLSLQSAAAEEVPVGAEQTGETEQQCHPGESALQ